MEEQIVTALRVDVQCNSDSTLISLENYSSAGLKYFSSFLNYLDKEELDTDNIKAVDVGYTSGVLTVVIEREAVWARAGITCSGRILQIFRE